MIMMDSPQDEEFARINKKALEEESNREAEYEELEYRGIKCDECDDTYVLEDLIAHETEEGHTILLCRYCKP